LGWAPPCVFSIFFSHAYYSLTLTYLDQALRSLWELKYPKLTGSGREVQRPPTSGDSKKGREVRCQCWEDLRTFEGLKKIPAAYQKNTVSTHTVRSTTFYINWDVGCCRVTIHDALGPSDLHTQDHLISPAPLCQHGYSIYLSKKKKYIDLVNQWFTFRNDVWHPCPAHVTIFFLASIQFSYFLASSEEVPWKKLVRAKSCFLTISLSYSLSAKCSTEEPVCVCCKNERSSGYSLRRRACCGA
jgi:hypothetical protein